jgi:hypothetical protein
MGGGTNSKHIQSLRRHNNDKQQQTPPLAAPLSPYFNASYHSQFLKTLNSEKVKISK